MTHRTDMNCTWPAAQSAAMVGADPARRVAQHVEGPTLLERELPFDRGLASVDRAPTCNGRSSRASAGAWSGRLLQATPRAVRAGFVATLVALIAAGCGGADPTAGATGTTPPVDTTAPGTTVNGTGTAAGAGTGSTGASMLDEPGMNDIAASQADAGVSVKISSRTPKAFVAANCARPIVVVLYQPTSTLDLALRKEVNIAVKKTKDELLLTYTPADVREYGDLPSKLGLFAAPGVAIVARDGTIENIWSGVYVDNKLIEASLRNAASATACKVAENAAAGGADPSKSLQGAAALVAGGGTAPAASALGATTPAAATTGLPTGTTTPTSTGVAPAAGTVPGATGAPVPAGAMGTGAATTPPATGTTPIATGGAR